jgi:hypothetical protein
MFGGKIPIKYHCGNGKFRPQEKGLTTLAFAMVDWCRPKRASTMLYTSGIFLALDEKMSRQRLHI